MSTPIEGEGEDGLTPRERRLRQRFQPPTTGGETETHVEKETPFVSQQPGTSSLTSTSAKVQVGQQQKSQRSRQSVYASVATMKAIDDAYKRANHDVYPEEIDKAAYFEALVAVALSHQDEIMAHLSSEQSE